MSKARLAQKHGAKVELWFKKHMISLKDENKGATEVRWAGQTQNLQEILEYDPQAGQKPSREEPQEPDEHKYQKAYRWLDQSQRGLGFTRESIKSLILRALNINK